MSQRLPALRPAKVLRAVEKAGFYVHQGSHHYLKHADKPGRLVTVAIHGKDLKRGTLAAIIKEAGFTVEEFLELL